jgi:hypothetical protein
VHESASESSLLDGALVVLAGLEELVEVPDEEQRHAEQHLLAFDQEAVHNSNLTQKQSQHPLIRKYDCGKPYNVNKWQVIEYPVDPLGKEEVHLILRRFCAKKRQSLALETFNQ